MRNIEIKTTQLDYSGAEAFKTLRTNLKFCGDDKRVIAITSCWENEGKSSVTLNLAISLAEAGEKVIMVDADMRKSVLVGVTRVNEEVNGLTHYLSRQSSLSDTVCVTNIENLHMLFAGPTPPNPTELLGSKYFHAMIEALKKAYDYVLIDTPPVGMVIDAAIIARECDGVMIVVQSGGESYKFVREVKEQLDKTQCPVLGVVLNKVDYSKEGYYGKYGRYGKYGKYGKYSKYSQYANENEQG
ncbi:MAG: polysaccharide biosynthesis tyrosine autokinase [Erysipelotrichaceae bacterium]|nr:polysaccharide biosynthesis tyrosine autokinase [Erysipelotrichaceae bacterium]